MIQANQLEEAYAVYRTYTDCLQHKDTDRKKYIWERFIYAVLFLVAYGIQVIFVYCVCDYPGLVRGMFAGIMDMPLTEFLLTAGKVILRTVFLFGVFAYVLARLQLLFVQSLDPEMFPEMARRKQMDMTVRKLRPYEQVLLIANDIRTTAWEYKSSSQCYISSEDDGSSRFQMYLYRGDNVCQKRTYFFGEKEKRDGCIGLFIEKAEKDGVFDFEPLINQLKQALPDKEGNNDFYYGNKNARRQENGGAVKDDKQQGEANHGTP